MRSLPIVLLFCCFISGAFSCSTPVFQYALERWEPDPFVMHIVHHQKLSNEHQNFINTANKHTEAFSRLSAFDLNRIEDTAKIPERLQEQANKFPQDQWPLVIVEFPGANQPRYPLYIKPLSKANLSQILNSPIRTELANRLSHGHSMVIVVLESGNATKDKAALATIQSTINETVPTLQEDINARLQAMDIDEEGDELADGTLNVGIPKVKISILQLKRDNAEELLFLSMLTRMLPDIHDSDEPVAFPVFGRGRVLWPMPAKDITPDNLQSSMEFLCGSCSCQIKDQNPGYDLMLCVDWETMIENKFIGQTELPALSGPSVQASNDKADAPSPLAKVSNEHSVSHSLTPLLLAGLVLLALVGGSALILLKRAE